MRIIRLKIAQAVQTRLSFIARELRITDEHYMQDLYALTRLKGHGLPSDARVAALVDFLAKQPGQSKASAAFYVRKRVQVYRNTVKMPYFTSLTGLTDPVHAVDRLLQNMLKLANKTREAQCKTCQLFATCQFGQQYAAAVTDITKVYDPDYARLVHEDCPSRPDMDRIHNFNVGLAAMAALMDPNNAEVTSALSKKAADDNGGGAPSFSEEELEELESRSDTEGNEEDEEDDIKPSTEEQEFIPSATAIAGRGAGYDPTFTNSNFLQKQETLIEQLCNTGLSLFEIGKNLADLLGKSDSKLLIETKELAQEKKQDNMRSHSEAGKIVPSQHAMPSEVFDTKLAKKQLTVNREHKPEGKKHLLYFLVDSTGSMRTMLNQKYGGRRNGFVSRASIATVVMIAMMKKIMDEKGIVFLRFFSGSAGPLIELRSEADFKHAIERMKNNNYDGSSTNIERALRTVYDDIITNSGDISRSEVLLVTDTEDHLEEKSLAALKATSTAKLNVLDVSGSAGAHTTYNYGGREPASKVLKKVADAYYAAAEGSVDLKKIVSLV